MKKQALGIALLAIGLISGQLLFAGSASQEGHNYGYYQKNKYRYNPLEKEKMSIDEVSVSIGATGYSPTKLGSSTYPDSELGMEAYHATFEIPYTIRKGTHVKPKLFYEERKYVINQPPTELQFNRENPFNNIETVRADLEIRQFLAEDRGVFAMPGITMSGENLSEESISYHLALGGFWQYQEDLWLIAGIYYNAGLEESQTLPLLGVRWTIDEYQSIEAILPILFKYRNNFADRWHFLAEFEYDFASHRLETGHPISEGVFKYRGANIGVGVEYELTTNARANLKLGGIVDREVELQNSSGDELWSSDVDQSMYVSGGVKLSF